MKKLISILMAFSIVFTNVSQNRMCVVHAAEEEKTTTEQGTCSPSCTGKCNFDDIGILSLLWKLTFRVVGGTIGAIRKAFVYSVRCSYRLLGVADEVLWGPDKTEKGREAIEQIEKCRLNKECKKLLEEILSKGMPWDKKEKLENILKDL